MATWDFSELDEAARLLRDLLQRNVSAGPAARPGVARAPGQRGPPPMPPDARSPGGMRGPAEAVPMPAHRSGRLALALSNLCRRSGFNAAVIADDSALPIAAHECPGGAERFAAFTTVLSGASKLARELLQQPQLHWLALEVEAARKIIVRRFEVASAPYYLLVLGPKAVDGHHDIDQTIALVQQMMSGA